MGVIVRGTWPGTVVLRHGWAKAEARPWNRDIPDAHLRLVRGGAAFLAECGRSLLEEGAAGVNSPPLAESSSGIWLSAGYEPYLELDLFRRELSRTLPRPEHGVVPVRPDGWDAPARIDRAAFEPLWRLEPDGLQEAMTATPHAALLLTPAADDPAGYAIVGSGSVAGYLQRVAVHPEFRGRGFGRALVRAAMRWAQRHGARSILLNTQPNNESAAALYREEGFEQLLDHLTVLRYE